MFVFRVFLICIFPHLDWIQKDMESTLRYSYTQRYSYLSVFCPNAGKYGSEKLQIQTHAVLPSTSNIIYRMTKTMEKFAKSVTCHRLKHSTKNFNLNFLFVKMNKYAGNCLFVLTRKKNPETKASCFSYWGT